MVNIGWRLSMALWVLFVSVLFGCSNQSFYEMNQKRNREDCQKLPDTEREECLAKNSMSYDEYRRERKSLE